MIEEKEDTDRHIHNKCVDIADEIVRNKGGLYNDLHSAFNEQGVKLTRELCLEIGIATMNNEIHWLTVRDSFTALLEIGKSNG